MIYKATRRSRSEGFEWDDGTPLEIQRCSDILMGCSVSDIPYYVICGHMPLSVTISEGERVDSRENRLYTATELQGKSDRTGGLALMRALLAGQNGQGTVFFPDAAHLESALRYAAVHLPRSRTAHLILSESDAESGANVLIVFRSSPVQPELPVWAELLPDFSEAAEGVVTPAETFDTVYDMLLAANSRNHDIRMLEFIAFACGGETDPVSALEFTGYMRQIPADEPLIKRYFSLIDEQDFDVPEMLPILYHVPGKRGDALVAHYTRKYLNAEKLHELEEEAPLPKTDTAAGCFAKSWQRGYADYSLEDEDIPSLSAVYGYIRDSGIKAKELREGLGRDANSISMIETIRAAELKGKSEDSTRHVHGVMPAVLYWYGDLSKAECAAMYGSTERMEKYLEQVRMLVMPKRMQQLSVQEEKRKSGKQSGGFSILKFVGGLLAAGLIFAGGLAVGGMLTAKRAAERAAEESSAAEQTSTTTALPTETTVTTTVPGAGASLRIQSCKMDADAQARAEVFLNAHPELPAGCDLSQGLVCYSVSAAELAAFSPDQPPAVQYMIPYGDEAGSGILLLTESDGTVTLKENVPSPAANTRPSVWFDPEETGRALDTLTAEPSAVMLLLCPDGPYTKLVYTVSSGTAYLIPYGCQPANAEGLLPLDEGNAYTAEAYLEWAGLAAAPAETETTAPAAATETVQ